MISFVVRDRDDPDYCPKITNRYAARFPVRTVRKKGVVYQIAGQQVELFTIRVLAEALDRTARTIETWEKSGLFPKPLFKLPKYPKRRYYSANQIINLHRIMLMRYSNRKSSTFNLESFCTDAKAVFYQPEIVIGEKGELLRDKLMVKK